MVAETGDALAKNVQLKSPRSIDFTPSGEMLVADFDNEVIRAMDSNGFARVIAGGGNELPKTPIPAKTGVFSPLSVVYARDGSDVLFIGDMSGNIYKLYVGCYGIESDNGAVCSGHGTCITTDQCKCDTGGTRFTSNHPGVCSGKGKCVRPNKCHCVAGHAGHKCHQPS